MTHISGLHVKNNRQFTLVVNTGSKMTELNFQTQFQINKFMIICAEKIIMLTIQSRNCKNYRSKL